jgi:hypothetical protein
MQNDKITFGISKRLHPTKPLQTIAKNQNTWNKIEKAN